jgi:hypothetical protein
MRFYVRKLALLTCCFTLLSAATKADDIVIGDDENGTDLTVNTVTVAWDPNSESDLAGYVVYYGRSSGTYARLVSVVMPFVTITIKGSKTTYFAVSAYDIWGFESDLSSEIHYP